MIHHLIVNNIHTNVVEKQQPYYPLVSRHWFTTDLENDQIGARTFSKLKLIYFHESSKVPATPTAHFVSNNFHL